MCKGDLLYHYYFKRDGKVYNKKMFRSTSGERYTEVKDANGEVPSWALDSVNDNEPFIIEGFI